MIEKIYNNKTRSEKVCVDIKVLNVDEAQDSSVIQRKAEEDYVKEQQIISTKQEIQTRLF